MYLKTKIALGIVLLLILQSPQMFAATTVPKPVNPVASGVPVANVSIKNAGILSQENNKVTIGFDLVNGKGVQSGVRYAVLLVSSNGAYLADESVYEESLVLAENSTIHRTIVYAAPSVFSGSYHVLLESRNENNLPLDIVEIGTVPLVVGIHGAYIDPSTCYLQVPGDKNGQHYTLTQNIDVRPSETLTLTCTALNQTENPITVTPAIETHYYSQYGSVVPNVETKSDAVTLPANGQKVISFTLPKGTTPQLYNAKVSLKAPGIPSNNIYVGYVIAGIQGSIKQISLDKPSYVKGDSGVMTIVWSAVAGNFARTGTKNTGAPGVSIKATITSGTTQCAAPIDQALTRDPKTGLGVIKFAITKNCKEPQVSASMTDMKGNVLDQKTIGFTPTETHGLINKTTATIIIIVVALIAIVGIAMLRRKRSVPVSPIE